MSLVLNLLKHIVENVSILVMKSILIMSYRIFLSDDFDCDQLNRLNQTSNQYLITFLQTVTELLKKKNYWMV
jgi:hypothetical protein